MSDDWQVGKTRLEANSHAFENQIGCDVTFTFTEQDGSKTSIGAHSFILVTASPVFDVMYSERWMQNNKDKVINIEDSTFGVFKEFLRYLYADKCNIDGDTALGLLYLAKKYIVTTLEVSCTKYVEEGLNASNVCKLLQSSTDFNHSDLEQRCLSFICKNTEAVFKAGLNECISRENLLRIVSLDILNCGSELAVYEACVSWASSVCKKNGIQVTDASIRDALGPVLYRLRFATLNVADLAECIGTGWVVSPEEKGQLFTYCSTQTKHAGFLFSTTRRICNVHTLDRFSLYGSASNPTANQVVENDQYHSLCFMSQVGVNINLFGITMIAGKTSAGEYKFNSGEIIIQKNTSRHRRAFAYEEILKQKTDEKSAEETVFLQFGPVQITSNIWYKISFKYDQVPTYKTSFSLYNQNYHQLGVPFEKGQITFQDSGDQPNHTSCNHGQFSKFFFEFGKQ